MSKRSEYPVCESTEARALEKTTLRLGSSGLLAASWRVVQLRRFGCSVGCVLRRRRCAGGVSSHRPSACAPWRCASGRPLGASNASVTAAATGTSTGSSTGLLTSRVVRWLGALSLATQMAASTTVSPWRAGRQMANYLLQLHRREPLPPRHRQWLRRRLPRQRAPPPPLAKQVPSARPAVAAHAAAPRRQLPTLPLPATWRAGRRMETLLLPIHRREPLSLRTRRQGWRLRCSAASVWLRCPATHGRWLDAATAAATRLHSARCGPCCAGSACWMRCRWR